MEQSPQLVMLKSSLSELPSVQLPQGYTSRTFQPGDEKAWENIIGQSFNKPYLFDTLDGDDQFRPERIFFICYDGTPVATASAWWQEQWGSEDTGYLHMVGALPDHTGKKLGYAVSLLAMHRMVEENRLRVILQTDDFRIPAIKSYLRLGYEPKIVHPNQIERWKLLLTVFNDQERLRRLPEPEVFVE